MRQSGYSRLIALPSDCVLCTALFITCASSVLSLSRICTQLQQVLRYEPALSYTHAVLIPVRLFLQYISNPNSRRKRTTWLCRPSDGDTGSTDCHLRSLE